MTTEIASTAESFTGAITLPNRREGIRPPKFADKFAWLDFDAEPMPVISMFPPPPVSHLADLAISMRGEDLKTRTVRWHELRSLPVREMAAPMVCQIFNWHEEVKWGGVRLSDFLDQFDPGTPADGYYAFHSNDGEFFETLSYDETRDPRVMLAYRMNGAPLAHEYGGPIRLVVPFLQGYKSVKWLGRIEAFRNDPIGIKRLLGQSKTGRLGQAWLDKLSIEPAAGRPGDP